MNGNSFTKMVNVTLAPGDSGPICSYSPYCSPTDSTCVDTYTMSSAPTLRKSPLIAKWRRATISMVEVPLDSMPRNTERQWVETWLLQLVRCELTTFLKKAEEEFGDPLQINVNDKTAALINRALRLRGMAVAKIPKPPHKRAKKRPQKPHHKRAA